jgi:PHD/YefM family antitoxin component YafN of YafNO toxin-antitoxin module
MTAQPVAPGPDTGSYEVIHLGGQAAVVVPVADFIRLRALEQAASPQDLEDAEDTAAVLEWRARDAAGQTTLVPADEVRRRLGVARS